VVALDGTDPEPDSPVALITIAGTLVEFDRHGALVADHDDYTLVVPVETYVRAVEFAVRGDARLLDFMAGLTAFSHELHEKKAVATDIDAIRGALDALGWRERERFARDYSLDGRLPREGRQDVYWLSPPRSGYTTLHGDVRGTHCHADWDLTATPCWRIRDDSGRVLSVGDNLFDIPSAISQWDAHLAQYPPPDLPYWWHV